MKVILDSLEQTRNFAQNLARTLQNETVTLALHGDLGAGKTAWTRFFGRALGVKRTINSPTFTIMKSYKMADGRPLWHLDAYRLEGSDQDLGFEDCFDEGICVVEWAEYLARQLPSDHLSLTFSVLEDQKREVFIQAHGENSARILEEWKGDTE